MAVERHCRFDDPRWLREILRAPGDILDLPLADLYRRVVFPADRPLV